MRHCYSYEKIYIGDIIHMRGNFGKKVVYKVISVGLLSSECICIESLDDRVAAGSIVTFCDHDSMLIRRSEQIEMFQELKNVYSL